MTHPSPQSGQPDDSKTLINEQTAFVGGVIATLVIGLPAALGAISQVINLLDDLILLAIATWLVWMMIQFWVSEAHKGGLTTNEIIKATLWPYDMFQTIKAGVRKQTGQTVWKKDDTSKKLLDEEQALWAGIIVSVVALVLLIGGIASAIAVIGGVIWLAFLGYIVGMFIQFWVSKAYTEGLTVNEVWLAVLWPVATFKTIKAGVEAKREAWKNQQP